MRWRRYNAAIAPIALQIAPANRPLHATNMHSMHTTRTTTTGYYYYSSMNTYSSNMHTIPPRTRTVSILYSMCILSSNNNTTSCTARMHTTYYTYIHKMSPHTLLVAVRTQFLQTPIVRASALIYDSYYSSYGARVVVLLFKFFALLRDRIV